MSDPVTPPSRGRTLKAAAPFIAGALVLGACSKSSDPINTATNNTTASTAATGGTSSGGGSNGGGATGTTQATGKSLNTTVYTDGFSYQLGGVGYDSAKNELTVDTTITNLGTDNATSYTSVSLLSADSTVSASGSVGDRKEIVGGKNVKDQITFSVDPGFKPSDTTLVFGSEGKQQAKVPLSGAGPVVTLAPVEQQTSLTDPLTIGTMVFTPSKVEIRYDNPADHTTADAGKAFLVITGNTKNMSTEQTNYWSTSDMQLASPDNQTYVADSVDPRNLGPTKSGATTMMWTIDDPNVGQLSGDYKLAITDQPFDADSGKVSIDAITLSLSDKPSSGGSGGTTGTTQKKGTTTTTSGG